MLESSWAKTVPVLSKAEPSRLQEEVPLDPLEVHHERGPTPSLGPTTLLPEAAAKPWRSHGMSVPHNALMVSGNMF